MVHHECKPIKRVQKMCSPSCFGLTGALILLFSLSLFLPAWLLAATDETAPGREMAKQATKEKRLWITSDHKQHDILKKKFTFRRKK